MVACSSGNTTASVETVCAIAPRCAGVVCTLTSASFSFSCWPQPAATSSTATLTPSSVRLLELALVTRISLFMELSALLSVSANSPAQRDTARRHPDMRYLLAPTCSAHQPPRAPSILHCDIAALSTSDFLQPTARSAPALPAH